MRKNSDCYSLALHTYVFPARQLSQVMLQLRLQLCSPDVAGTASVRPCARTPCYASACQSECMCALQLRRAT